MDIYDLLFMFQLLVFVGLTFLKVWNVMHGARKVGFTESFVLFAVGLLFYGLGFVTSTLTAARDNFAEVDLIYLAVFNFETVLLPLFFVLFFGELLFYLSGIAKKFTKRSGAYISPRA